MTITTEIGSIDDFLEHAKRLRSNAEAAEVEFLSFLRDFEVSREDLWKTAGVASYDSFLQSLALCNPARYRNFITGTNVIRDRTTSIGAAATIAAARFRQPTVEAVSEYVARCENFREIHEVAPSEQTARSWVKQLDQAEPKVVRQVSRLRQLEAENQQLRAESRQFQAKLKEAEKLIDRLQKELGKKTAA